MPINAKNKHHYQTPVWKAANAAVRERSGNRCEFCGIENGAERWNKAKNRMGKVVLTVAHLNHQPGDDRLENLKVLCQACHLGYDKDHHAQSRRENKKDNTNAQPTLL